MKVSFPPRSVGRWPTRLVATPLHQIINRIDIADVERRFTLEIHCNGQVSYVSLLEISLGFLSHRHRDSKSRFVQCHVTGDLLRGLSLQTEVRHQKPKS